MKLNIATCGRIARLIEGEDGFPHRTSHEMTQFFHDLGINAVFTDSSKGKYALRIIKSIDTGNPQDEELPDVVVRLLKYLVDPKWFEYNHRFLGGQRSKLTQGECVEHLDKILLPHGLQMNWWPDEGGRVELGRLDTTMISTVRKPAAHENVYKFRPDVFRVPDAPEIDQNLVSVMMPFNDDKSRIFHSINIACESVGFSCKCAEDIWEESEIIHDVFGLIWKSKVVICDFTGMNANVFYEAGIAHTLGKQLIPISQRKNERLPFDVQHHRHLFYEADLPGLTRMKGELVKRLKTIQGL